jgi:hypothetical protein
MSETHEVHNRRAHDGFAAWRAPSVIIQLVTALLLLGAIFARVKAFENVIDAIPNTYVRRDVYVVEQRISSQQIDQLTDQIRNLRSEIQELKIATQLRNKQN